MHTKRMRSTHPLHQLNVDEWAKKVSSSTATTTAATVVIVFPNASYRLDNLNFHLICVHFFCAVAIAASASCWTTFFMCVPYHAVEFANTEHEWEEKTERNKSRSTGKNSFYNYCEGWTCRHIHTHTFGRSSTRHTFPEKRERERERKRKKKAKLELSK